jgi:putative transposase
MKKKRFSEEQIIRILREAEKGELTVGDLCRKHAVSEQSFYRWRNKFGDMDVNDAKRLRSMEKENAQLKRLVAERDMEIDAMKELLSKKW